MSTARLGESGVAAVNRLTTLCAEMDATLLAIYNLDPEAHATKSRDYGRGFAEALRIVRAEIDTRMGAWAASQTSTRVNDTPNPRASDDPAHSAASGAGSSSPPSAAPTDSLPDPKGQEPA